MDIVLNWSSERENGRFMANGQVAPAEQLWGSIRRDGCLRVLARTGRADCRRSCASFPPFSGSIAMSILNIEWYYCHVDIVRGALANARAARSSGCASKIVGTRKSSSYLARRLATAELKLAAVMMICIRITQRCTRGGSSPPWLCEELLFISSRNGARAQEGRGARGPQTRHDMRAAPPRSARSRPCSAAP